MALYFAKVILKLFCDFCVLYVLLAFLACFLQHLITTVEQPRGFRWQHFRDEFYRGFALPLLRMLARNFRDDTEEETLGQGAPGVALAQQKITDNF
ncbi:hypothetical protein GGI43DRAFT_388475 [Trichoderma evansii]